MIEDVRGMSKKSGGIEEECEMETDECVKGVAVV
jgi:hypothetical protein